MMKQEEAIKSMRNLNMVLSITDSERESVNMAVAALEKQIPQKPVRKDDVYENYTSEPIQAYVCPSCGEVLIAIKTKELLKLNLFFAKPKFCQECGQAIEWE